MSAAEKASEMPFLEFRNLTVQFGDVVALREFNLSIAPGERVGLIGESGSGKTTAGLAGIGIVQKGGRITSGEVLVEGRAAVHTGDGARAKLTDPRLAMVFQDAKLAFDPLRTIGSHLYETLAVHSVPRSEWKQRSADLLAEVGLLDPVGALKQYPHQLSGGMRQRAMIAVGLAADPKLLVADEPTSSLDVTTQAAVIDLLERLSDSRGMGMLFISHDIELVRSFVSRVLVMKSGDVVEQAPTEELFAAPQNEYTVTLLNSTPAVPEVSERVAQLASQRADKDDDVLAVDVPPVLPELGEPGPDSVISVRDLTKVFISGPPFARKRFSAVDGISFDLAAGETLGIVGASGSGKTTTARMIAGLLRPTSGQITFGSHGAQRQRGELQMVFQDPADTMDPLIRVADAVAEPLRIKHGGSAAKYREQVTELLAKVGLGEQYLDRLPSQLSGGQRQRVAIARALSTKPSVIVADEPVSALDASLRGQILQLFADLQAETGVSFIQITHDLLTARASCDRIAVMHLGKIVEFADADTIFAAPQHPYTQRLIASIPAVRAKFREDTHV